MATDALINQRQVVRTEILNCLNTYGKCAFIRPTGWGKTWTTASIVDEYKKVLYLYPTKAIRNTFLYAYYTLKFQEVQPYISGVILMSYAKLRHFKDKEDFKLFKGVDLIIADECDILGAPETARAVFDLLAIAKKAHFLGATATPERQDMVDEVALFFDDHLISDYTLKDAIQDNIIQKPYYVTCCYDDTAKDILAAFKKQSAIEVDKMSHLHDKQWLGAYFQAKQLECSNLLKMENVIPEELEKAGLSTNYQKFIVFFSNYKDLHEKENVVKGWFETAFPNHKVQTLTVTVENKQTKKNVDKLDKLVPKDNTIHLIYTCNLVNMGYHVDTLTGIIMIRGTGSSHIFIQQLGRVLSTGSAKPGIVFDVADNLHRPAIYKMCWDNVFPGAETEDGDFITQEEITEYEKLVVKIHEKDDDNRPIPLSKNERKRFLTLKKKISRIKKPESHTRKPLGVFDFVVSSREATVKEIIGKSVAEPISMRCRQAWSRWKEKGGDDSIMTKEFILSQQPPSQTPLPPFCRLKHVSVEAVLNEMGVK